MGCDVGAFSIANMEFETLPGDVITVFGANSPQVASVKAEQASSSAATRQQANTDWLGIAVHCAQGSALCASGGPDLLPDEPGGYTGFNALYGNINVQPAISPSGPVKDLDGNVIADAFGHPGFPNIFDPTATQSLGYAATMLEAGIQVVYLYIEDAHDNHAASGTFGPGEAGYVAQLQQYDVAWGKFFARLKADGMDKSNTLFVITADEGDHFVGGAPSPAGCDGVHVPCTYIDPRTGLRDVGELTSNIDSILFTQTGNTTPFLVHSDDAPNFYIQGNPGATTTTTRKLEQDLGSLTWVNPLFGKNNEVDQLAPFLADRAEMGLLHMITASPARTPSLTVFGDPDYFFQTTRGSLPLNPQNCSTTPSLCVSQGPNFAWNHGDVQDEIVHTWLGIVGPGVKARGITDEIWSDHTDVRPTMLALAGLVDDYQPDGRVLVEALRGDARNGILHGDDGTFERLAAVYKQITAPVGRLSHATLRKATSAIMSASTGDAAYTEWLAQAAALQAKRDPIIAEMKALLTGAAFGGQRIDPKQADRLIERAADLFEDLEGHRDHDHD
jgi:hypothetical protein